MEDGLMKIHQLMKEMLNTWGDAPGNEHWPPTISGWCSNTYISELQGAELLIHQLLCP